MSLLQVFASKTLRCGSSKAVSCTVHGTKAKTLASTSPRSFTPAGAANKYAARSMTRISVAKYTTQAPSDQEQVWEDLDGIQDFYDPRFDSDYPEEEGAAHFSTLPSPHCHFMRYSCQTSSLVLKNWLFDSDPNFFASRCPCSSNSINGVTNRRRLVRWHER